LSSLKERGLNPNLGGFQVSVKRIGLVLSVVFAIALAVVVAKQMSSEAMAVVVGVVCGVAAGIPTSLLLVLVLNRRERQQYERAEGQARQGSYPPVVVIQGGGQPGLLPGSQAGYWPVSPAGAAMPRQFHVVGGDDLLVEDRGF
jgi:hypothetical protein